MIKSFTSIFLLFSFSLFGQETQPRYQILKNDPANVSYINIGIDPFVYSLDGGNVNDAFYERLLYSPFVTVMYKNRLVADISYTRSYFKKEAYNKESANGLYANPENGIKNFSDFSVVGKYYFLENIKQRNLKVPLKKRSTLKSKVNVCNMWGLRGGISVVQKPIDGEDIDIYGYYTNDPGHTEIPFNTNYLTMAHFTTVSLGLSFCQIVDVILNIDEHGKKNGFQNGEFYIDIQRVMSASFDNMRGPIYGQGSSGTIHVTDVRRANWGFKVGTMSSNNNRLGLRLGMEAGFNAIPVYLYDNGGKNAFFFNFRMGIGFAQRLNRSS